MEYKVTVATGTSEYSGTNNYVYVTLVGERGASERTLLDNPGLDLCRGAVDEYTVRSSAPLGRILLVRLEKQRYWVEDNWFCRYVTVTSPGGHSTSTFPCYCWLVGDVQVEVREGTAKKQSGDTLPQERAHRKAELQERQKIYRWQHWAPGLPKCIDAKSEADLPQDARFANEKRSDFERSLQFALLELSLKKLVIKFGKSWDDLDDFKRIFWQLKSSIAEYTMQHWREDWFFGYQFLNGSNPRMIQRCKKLPSNFPVSGDMVQAFLGPNTTLDKEIKAGNVFLVDHGVMDGIPANSIRNQKQYIAAPLCLLYEHPDKGLIPIAIQLEQNPSRDTPIFLPNDPPLAWLLAKMWVRHAEFQVFQVLSHLLSTHLVVEVICVATLRQLPAVHPIYKLLSPHLKYSLEINCRARTQLISADGIFKRVVSTGGEGLLVLAQRGYKVFTYRSLHPRFDFVDRGVNKLKNYFYRDHVLMLWEAIHKFVSSMVSQYYSSDSEVEEDTELQAWISDVTEEGFVDAPQFGLANDLKTREELITLLSVVIFTSTAQHAATNNGQFDWCAWVPNTPCTMRQPPPTDKDAVTMGFIMDTLPDISQSCVQMAITWHLGRVQPDAIPLAQYAEQYFTEPEALRVIDSFREDLKEVEEEILRQNKGLELPYLYLCPSRIENSITI
ncbi:arachidonate 12-lipoxygenase, 12S-type isoform X2 [Electrophorus electricus]|uniref:Arachidonate 12-lipoxygenase n=2 Tax=Electrophorus electricus TaxID=8005 RepID=A0A4W4FJJ1_ELEEL|nr:arachidonate 12-lipoxygenase, 12S-type isoform X2 [Electrophorus electricus]XP_026871365.2 arachidonate 12-lipoxygenase, 12S-type isoform X2 [Electrophorus electricus]XP_026871366.2 arachidonate 12-lipoxygenase, 12S-type isoform X2 [Electrophorus electricus]